VIIHTNGSKSKQSEVVERERQRNGEDPSENKVGKRYLEGIDDDEMLVATTHSGSMTQETFVHFARHFVDSLPPNSGPVVLFLDGHGSRWNVHALNYLMENNVYPFFLASHTSIWAQPNDAGVNKRFHWCVEFEIKSVRRTCRSAPTVKYFNEALCNAVRLFRETERGELRSLGENSTTSSYRRTGVFPLDPFAEAWTDAIESLGKFDHGKEAEDYAVSYEPILKDDLPTLTAGEREVLRSGMTADVYSQMLDSEVALLCAGEILGAWRDRVDNGVREGETRRAYSRALLPSACLGGSEKKKIASSFVDFQMIDVHQIVLPTKNFTKEEKCQQQSTRIITNTAPLEPVKIRKWLAPPATTEAISDGEDDNSDGKKGSWETCLGFKSVEGTWKLQCKDGAQLEIEEKEVLDGSKYRVAHAYQDRTPGQVKKESQRTKRQRRIEQLATEKLLEQTARTEREKQDCKEFDNLKRTITDEGLTIEYFQAMVERLRSPFTTKIDDHIVTVSQEDSAIMIKGSSLQAITEKVLATKSKRQSTIDTNNENNNKRRRTGTATTNTAVGAPGIVALHSSQRRNAADQSKREESERKKAIVELEGIEKCLQLVQQRKMKCGSSVGFSVRAENYEDLRAGCENGNSENGVTPHVPDYWALTEMSDQSELVLFLRLFSPASGKLSKAKPVQWQYIVQEILPVSRARYDSTVEQYELRRIELEMQLGRVDD
jgi:hypothetical protein